jgi:tRNA(Ile)-lysidine synthase
VDMALDVIRLGQVGAWIDLPSGVYLERGYNSFWLAVRGAREAGAKMPEDPAPLPVPGAVVLPVGTIEATLANAAPEEQVTESYWLAGRNEAYLDADKVGPSLDVRRRRPGDRLIPLGMSSPKKLHDFLIDQKVPRGERDRIPIVGTPEAIAWVAGFRIDERFKVTADTKRILVLKYRG